MTNASFDDEQLPPEPPAPDNAVARRPRYQQDQPQRYEEYRQPPSDREAEQGVLGAMLLSPNTVMEVIEELEPDDFYYPAHALIYGAMLDLYAAGQDIDPLILSSRLDRFNNLERVGGAPYLHTLLATVPTAANARYYAEIVAEKAVLRRLVDAGTRVVQLGFSGTEDAEIESVIDRAQQEVFAIAQRKTAEDYRVLGDLIDPTIDELAALQQAGGVELGVPTGFIDLDKLTNGLHAGQMIIVAARPGVGKSTLAMDFIRSCSLQHGKSSVIFSLEMSASEIVMRLLSAESEVKLTDMRSGGVSTEDWAKIDDTLNRIQDAPLFIDDSPNLTMMEIRSKARRLKQQHGLDLIVLDYLQLMSSGKKVESRQQEVSEFSRQLKLLAKELEVPVIAISQLNRGPEARNDKKPQLADLRESGSLEQDADMVMLLYRPDSQDRDNERAGEADIILAKHRGGPIDTVQVAHQLHYSKFVNMAHG
ncbi:MULTISPECIES: replicative DNA helicase [Corynebacterium]|jgi:replicative DNA helicase|uniref:Replicative DNA helicase n=1 Tax=Corynebacterium segmentosum TaxID=43990 RepID=A0ABY6TGV4_9CORY|nr:MULTISPECIES: replicative DNA helicase [Corynebacterium]EEI14954.1 replicative DNA helicase [Corynebacterium accolens ATCC 49725]EFM44893.1 replicative DNA helicase [Corynebacterium accolens ATCC 49726]ERS43077.1 replicative DNA helicase [Corynebacterium sp. KPL1996]ERS45123.1 replicative DNA helicase [Corynebacterium sp. KPL1986]ERS54713.1 replicative DNA helicase [Corynebacterium sp. KPL1824]